MATAIDTLGTLFKPMGSGVSVNYTLLLYGILICVLAVIIAIVWVKVRNRKLFDVLVEITPAWSIKSEIVGTQVQKKMNAFDRLLKRNPKTQYIEEDYPQDSSSYFVAGQYAFDKNKGIYFIRLKDKAKTKIAGIEYIDRITKKPFFKEITYGRFHRYIHLVRYAPADYKPVVSEFNPQSLAKVQNIFDSESTYVALQTQEEIYNRFKKGSKFLTVFPWIAVVLIVIVFVVGLYIQWQGIGEFTKKLDGLVGALGEYTKAFLMVASKP